MKFFNIVNGWLSDLNTKIDFMADVRTTSASVAVIGGVSRFFGFHNSHYVTIIACFTWIVTSFTIYVLRRK